MDADEEVGHVCLSRGGSGGKGWGLEGGFVKEVHDFEIILNLPGGSTGF